MLKIFRIASLLEGCSYLLILCVTLGFISRELVYSIGMVHGVLFLLYFVFSLLASHKQAWSLIVWLLVFLASIIPFAFVAVEVFVKKELRKNEKST
jgi:integral membrane protein